VDYEVAARHPGASSKATGSHPFCRSNSTCAPDIGDAGLRIAVVKLGGGDQGGKGRRPSTAFVGAVQSPVLASDRDCMASGLSGVVGYARSAVVEEALNAVKRLTRGHERFQAASYLQKLSLRSEKILVRPK
jgi:hypothetical protein